MIVAIASMFLSTALAAALVSRAAIMEAAIAGVENRAAIFEAKKLAGEIAERCHIMGGL